MKSKFKTSSLRHEVPTSYDTQNSYFSDQSIPTIPATTAGSGNAVIEEVDDMVTVEDAGKVIETIIVDESEEDEVVFIPPIDQIEESIFTKPKVNDKCVPNQPQKVQSVPINHIPCSTQPNEIQSVPVQPSTSKPFECHICRKTYKRKQSLKCHILSHDKSKWQYKCDKEGCTAIFYMKSSLNDHSRIHTGEKNQICFNQGCGKSYTNHQTRNRHSKFHCKHLEK